jgi:histidine triad (HIT) family protein
MDCIFCKILKGKLPGISNNISEEWATIVPKEQVAKGHILLIPIRHITDFSELDKDQLSGLGIALQKVANFQTAKVSASGFNILLANGKDAQQSFLNHLHFHVVPRFENDGLDLWLREKL